MTENKFTEFPVDNIIIHGNGSSLWCQELSQGDWLITQGELESSYLDSEDGYSYNLSLYGPDTVWTHYTDHLIEQEVNKYFQPLLAKIIGKPIVNITWSEQGLQPEQGWNFDVLVEE